MRTVGVEEEHLIVGADGTPTALAAAVVEAADTAPAGGPQAPRASDLEIPGGAIDVELKEEQVEISTRPCVDLAALGDEIREGRRRASAGAVAVGARVVALATSPLPVRSTVTPRLRYRAMTEAFGLTAREQLTGGCHVHVAVADDEEAVAALDRIGPWLAPLLALSANSPFWQGEDSGYASFRSQVWSRWPSAGPPPRFGSAEAYRDAVRGLIESGTVLDAGMIYFDARPSARYPTLEVRIADVCLDADTATLLGALARALVETAAREAADGVPAPRVPSHLLRAASWRAGRSGLNGDLVSPTTWRPAPSHDVVGEVVAHVRQALVDAGDLDAVTGLLGRLWAGGTGAAVQRAWWAASGDLRDVVDRAATRTLD